MDTLSSHCSLYGDLIVRLWLFGPCKLAFLYAKSLSEYAYTIEELRTLSISITLVFYVCHSGHDYKCKNRKVISFSPKYVNITME